MFEELEVGGKRYRIGRLDAKKQFHVARRLGPILAGLGESAGKSADTLPAQIAPIAGALSKMSDEDVDYVLDACLGVCHRVESIGQYAPVMARGGMMFSDIDMGQMVQLAVAVIQGNLRSFFPAAAA